MDFFSSFFQNETKPFLEEQQWLNECIEWIVEVIGFQNLSKINYHFNKETFPIAFQKGSFSMTNFSQDICPLLQIKSNQILIETSIQKRERDFVIKQITKSDKIYYQIILYNFNANKPIPAINQCVFALSLIRLIENNFQYDYTQNNSILIYIAMTFLGFGNFVTYTKSIDSIIFNDIEIPIKHYAYINAFIAWLQNNKPPKDFLTIKQKKAKQLLLNAFENISDSYSRSKSIKHYKGLNKLNEVLQKSWKFYQKNEYDKAIQSLTPIEKTHPHPEIVYNLLGQYYYRKKDLEKGKGYFEKVIELDNQNFRAFSQIGFYYLMQKNIQKGLQFLKNAQKLNQYDALTHRNFGIYYAIQRDFLTAYHHFDTAIELNPSLELVHYYYAIAKLTNHEKDDAVEQLLISKRYNEPESILKLEGLKG